MLSRTILAAALAASSYIATPCSAQTWTGASAPPFATNNLWSNPLNWNPFGLPLQGNQTDLIFGPSQRLTTVQDLGNPFTARALYFSTPGYQLSGFPIAATLIHNDAPSLTIANNLLLSGTTTYTGEGSAHFTGVLSGTGGLVKSGAGSLTLNASNTFTGTTQIQTGQITIGAYDALANSTVQINTHNGLNVTNQDFPVLGGLPAREISTSGALTPISPASPSGETMPPPPTAVRSPRTPPAT